MENKQTEDKCCECASVYNEDGDISFRGVWAFIKKSALRMLIYLVAAIVVVTAVFLGFRIAKGEYAVTAKTEMLFDGIGSGLNPDGTRYDKDAVKNVINIKTAAAAAGLADTLSEKGYDVSDVRDKIFVEPVFLEEEVDYPTQYTVSFKRYRELGITDEQAREFVDALLAAYGENFAETYFAPTVFSDASFETRQSEIYDFIDDCDIFSAAYENLRIYLIEYSAKAPSFRSLSGKSFESLKNELSAFQNSLSSLRFHIARTGAFKDLEVAKIKMKNKSAELDVRQTELTTIVTEMKEQLKNFQPSTSTVIPSGGDHTTMTVTYPREYVDLQLKLTGYIEQLAAVESLKADIAVVSEQLSAVTDKATPEQMQEVKAELDGLGKLSKEFVASVNELSREYAQFQAAKNGVTISFPAAYGKIVPSFPVAFSYLIAAVAAIVLALAVTAIISAVKRRKKAKEKPAVQEQ